MEALDRLVRVGKVRFIGTSNFLAWRLEEVVWINRTHGLAEYCCIKQCYSYLHPKVDAVFEKQLAALEITLSSDQMAPLTSASA